MGSPTHVSSAVAPATCRQISSASKNSTKCSASRCPNSRASCRKAVSSIKQLKPSCCTAKAATHDTHSSISCSIECFPLMHVDGINARQGNVTLRLTLGFQRFAILRSRKACAVSLINSSTTGSSAAICCSISALEPSGTTPLNSARRQSTFLPFSTFKPQLLPAW
jgi:hypothetical protein